jgi:hypothetical protein
LRSLPHDLIAAGDLPAQRLGRLVRNPDLRQEAARVELSLHAGVDRVGLDLRMRDDAYLLRVGDHDPLHVRRNDPRDGRRVTGRFDHHDVLRRKPCRKGRQELASHVDAAEPPELAVVPPHRLRESAVDIQSDDAHARSLRLRLVRTGAGGQHGTY